VADLLLTMRTATSPGVRNHTKSALHTRSIPIFSQAPREVSGLKYTCTFSRFPDGKIGELFLNNHKSSSTADVNARDAAITFSIAVQHGADPEVIRRALCRDANGRASGLLAPALDNITGERGR
jgi:hypothetical protein